VIAAVSAVPVEVAKVAVKEPAAEVPVSEMLTVNAVPEMLETVVVPPISPETATPVIVEFVNKEASKDVVPEVEPFTSRISKFFAIAALPELSKDTEIVSLPSPPSIVDVLDKVAVAVVDEPPTTPPFSNLSLPAPKDTDVTTVAPSTFTTDADDVPALSVTVSLPEPPLTFIPYPTPPAAPGAPIVTDKAPEAPEASIEDSLVKYPDVATSPRVTFLPDVEVMLVTAAAADVVPNVMSLEPAKDKAVALAACNTTVEPELAVTKLSPIFSYAAVIPVNATEDA